jgi:hypothetical protein
MLNLSRPEMSEIIIPLFAPPQVRVVGSSAEWIVERRLMGQTLPILPAYISVKVTEVAVWSRSGSRV